MLIRLVRQRHPLSPLLFIIVTYQILAKMHGMSLKCKENSRTYLLLRKQLIAQALADDSFVFSKAPSSNIAETTEV